MAERFLFDVFHDSAPRKSVDEPRLLLEGHSDGVLGVAITLDGGTIISGVAEMNLHQFQPNLVALAQEDVER